VLLIERIERLVIQQQPSVQQLPRRQRGGRLTIRITHPHVAEVRNGVQRRIESA
jgi:hypothetical protein